MPLKINRFYKPNCEAKEKIAFDEDFDNLDDFLDMLFNDIRDPQLDFKQEPIEEAFRTRLELILFQNKFRTYYLIEGIVSGLNNNNLPAVIPLIRAFLELVAQLGYIYWQISRHNDYVYLMDEPLLKISLGNRNDGTGPFSLGHVTSVNIMTMFEQANKAWNLIKEDNSQGEGSDENSGEELLHLYADLSNQSHPNYISNMFYSSIDTDGKVKTLKDVGQDMESIKPLVYGFYFSPLSVGIGLYHLFMGRIYEDPKVQRIENV